MAWLVNGEYVDDGAIREESELIRKRLRDELPGETPLEIDLKAREWAKDNVIERVLLRQAALEFTATAAIPVAEKGCATAVSHESLSEGAQPDWRLGKLLENVTQNVSRPPRREIVDFYRKNQALFLVPESAHASHIVKNVVKNVDEQVSEAEAQAAIVNAEAELKAGRPFAQVADEHSDCPGRGGELGWFPRGEMVDEFEAVVFSLKPGQVSGIFRSPFGFHIALLHDKRPAGVLPLSDAYARVEETLLTQRREQAIESFLDSLRAKAEIRRVSAPQPDLPA